MHQLRIFAAAAAVCFSSAAINTQASTAGAPQRGTTASERLTVTGCVERADQLNPAGASTFGTTIDSMSFVLMKAEPSNTPDTPVAVGTSGSIGPLYRLDADADQLNPHVGQKVEVIGTRAGTTVDDAAAQAANAANPSSAHAPVLKVESIKVLAETCGR